MKLQYINEIFTKVNHTVWNNCTRNMYRSAANDLWRETTDVVYDNTGPVNLNIWIISRDSDNADE